MTIACHPVALFAWLLLAWPSASTPRDSAEWVLTDGLATRLVARGLRAPVFVTSPPGDPRLFVVEQPGRIRIVRAGAAIGQRRPYSVANRELRSGYN